MKTLRCLALVVASALSFDAAIASTMTKLGLAEISSRADVAVVGKITESRSVRTANGVYTLATVAIEQSIWGTQSSTVTVAMPGGHFSTSKLQLNNTVAGVPHLMAGMRAVFMLTPDAANSAMRVVGLDQGLFPVVKTEGGDSLMLPGATALTSLASATAAIRAARSSAGAKQVAP